MNHHRTGRGGGERLLYGVFFYVVVFCIVFIAVPTFIAGGWFFHVSPPDTGFQVKLWRDDLGQLVTLDLEKYIAGVVAAEMPASFPMEALKAQAVTARTYAVYRMTTGRGVPGHPGADLSSDYRSGQAWISLAKQREQWGFFGYYLNRLRISQAVAATRGEILTYQGEPIFAAYHSTSGGWTQDSGTYFGHIPYLRAVPSPWEEASPYFRTTTRMGWKEIIERLELDVSGLPFDWEKISASDDFLSRENTKVYEPEAGLKEHEAAPGEDSGPYSLLPSGKKSRKAEDTTADRTEPEEEPLAWKSFFRVVEASPAGWVKTVEVFGQTFTGRKVREKLGLRSNCFTAKADAGGVTFHLRGNGHGVGMSQYGAQGMARAGRDYREILFHYYQDVELTRWY